ncbi:hypothetical protein OAT16_00970 [Prolixibacteraceae bacterium]|nr:hypothetical protein [Prolixibacteraceae bacterium]
MKHTFSSNIRFKRTTVAILLLWLAAFAPIYWLSTVTQFDHGVYTFAHTFTVAAICALALLIIMLIGGNIIPFYIYKETTKGVNIQGEPIAFHGKLRRYIGRTFLTLLLSLLSYLWLFPFYLKARLSYQINQSTFRGHRVSFRGSSRMLTLYYLVIPLFIYYIFPEILHEWVPATHSSILTVLPPTLVAPSAVLLTIFLMAYLLSVTCKWGINIRYKRYHLHSRSNAMKFFLPWIAVIVVSCVTIGLLFPVMKIWIINRYIEDMEATSTETTIIFHSNMSIYKEGVFAVGQMILCILTLWVYFPIAKQRVLNRMVSQIGFKRISSSNSF